MIRFEKLPGFGVEADGVDLALPLPDADFAELERAFYEHHVLALRGQDIGAAQFLAFARRHRQGLSLCRWRPGRRGRGAGRVRVGGDVVRFWEIVLTRD